MRLHPLIHKIISDLTGEMDAIIDLFEHITNDSYIILHSNGNHALGHKKGSDKLVPCLVSKAAIMTKFDAYYQMANSKMDVRLMPFVAVISASKGLDKAICKINEGLERAVSIARQNPLPEKKRG